MDSAVGAPSQLPPAPIEIRLPEQPFTAANPIPGKPFLAGIWYVTHSSLPLWKDKRNVKIIYTPMLNSEVSCPAEECQCIGDVVTYQEWSTFSNQWKDKTISGIDRWQGDWETGNGKMLWRGKGWLKIATSEWQILSHGIEAGSGRSWMVTYFAKTLFTPIGLDVLCNHEEGLPRDTVDEIMSALMRVEDPVIKKLAGQIFKVGKVSASPAVRMGYTDNSRLQTDLNLELDEKQDG